MTLSQRIQTASADETRALLEEAYEAVHGKSCDWFRYYGEIDQKHDARAFDNMLNAEAYLDAAMMLLPVGWLIVSWSDLGGGGGCYCTLGCPGRGASAMADNGERTLALALLSAICMARGL